MTGAPDVPTFEEKGYPFYWEQMRGVVGPAGMAPEAVAWWQDTLKKVDLDQEVAGGLHQGQPAHADDLDGRGSQQVPRQHHRQLREGAGRSRRLEEVARRGRADVRSADRIAGAALLALAVAFSAGALKHYAYWGENGPGPAFLPFWLGLVMAVLATMLLVGALRATRSRRALAAARRRPAPPRARPRRDDRLRRAAQRRSAWTIGTVLFLIVLMRCPRSPAVAADDRGRARGRRAQPPRLRALAARAVADRPVRLLSSGRWTSSPTSSLGFSVALTPFNLLMATCGVVIGILIGALPGIGPPSGVALLLPLTFGMDPTSGIIMLAALYAGTMYGGTITSVLINTPGESASVVTCLDGHQMALQGRAGAGARHRRDRLVHRRDDRRRPADAGLAGAGALVARLRPARDLRADAARPDHGDAAHRRERAQGLHQHGARADARDGRLRHHLGRCRASPSAFPS